MKYLLFILCFSILISEDIYPNFTDIAKQLEFEKKRIYIEDKSGERMTVTGGYLLANKEYTELVKEYPFLSRPILKQQFSNEQIKSFADSYNRKVYDEIKNQ